MTGSSIGRADLVVEIGTEELPPKSLPQLMAAFAETLAAELTEHRLAFDSVESFAAPRRLAVIVRRLAVAQPDRDVESKGPPVRIAFDADGNATAAAMAFAKKCGVDVSALGRSDDAKGERLSYRSAEVGVAASHLLPFAVENALQKLPVARPMRWGSSAVEFVRPIHWIMLLHGSSPVPGKVLGVEAGAVSFGHRFMAPGPVALDAAEDYPESLERIGKVVADFSLRRKRVDAGIDAAAASVGGSAIKSDGLLDEVTALVEWPVALAGRFDDAFLSLPREVIVATLTGHQRYFPVESASGELKPAFVTVANLESLDPDKVRDGNERVIQPRLADAAFFWNADRKQSLADRRSALERVVYQQGLGSLADRSGRIAELGERIAEVCEADSSSVRRAAELSKTDLLTGMVGEFPELQGTMGRYYATADGEKAAVAAAIEEQYRPRFAGDEIPQSRTGQVLALADKLDAIGGAFALGKKPSGNRDPFGLRRSALGSVRILVEGALDVDLVELIKRAVELQPVDAPADVDQEIHAFLIERMRSSVLGQDGVSAEMFEAVRERKPKSLLDFDRRLRAVAAFVDLDAAASLAAANKRIVNILRKADHDSANEPDPEKLTESAETDLFVALKDARETIGPMLAGRKYRECLAELAALRDPVDRFFDEVMVMADDAAVRRNRLNLLASLREQFLNVADISRLAIS